MATATHILDGQLLEQRVDGAGRTYYLDVETRRRAATAGKTPALILDSEGSDKDAVARILADLEDQYLNEGDPYADELDDPDAPMPIPDPPTEIDLEAMTVAIMAYRQSYAEIGRTSARYAGEGQVILSLPADDGGHNRYLIIFPESFPVHAEHAPE